MKCFRDAGFPTGTLDVTNHTNATIDDDLDDDIPLIELQKRINFENLDDVTELENTIPTEESYDGDWEKKLLDSDVGNENTTDTENESDEDDEPVPEVTKTDHTYETLLDLFKEAREFALVKDDKSLLFHKQILKRKKLKLKDGRRQHIMPRNMSASHAGEFQGLMKSMEKKKLLDEILSLVEDEEKQKEKQKEKKETEENRGKDIRKRAMENLTPKKGDDDSNDATPSKRNSSGNKVGYLKEKNDAEMIYIKDKNLKLENSNFNWRRKNSN
ncbi:unnamed protein product [Mytilus coruscus]|uniref:Uncharacterized protein n=1 Tax=Mytilus coruscus TaxID=42192 RepID=A0A6J8BRL6_MYTCO|nr:unnamed protein product [Mytilus coruscus]